MFNYENGTPKSLQNPLSVVTGLLQDSYEHSYQHSDQEIIALLSRDHKTPDKRLQHSYQEITTLLSGDYGTLINRLQHS